MDNVIPFLCVSCFFSCSLFSVLQLLGPSILTFPLMTDTSGTLHMNHINTESHTVMIALCTITYSALYLSLDSGLTEDNFCRYLGSLLVNETNFFGDSAIDSVHSTGGCDCCFLPLSIVFCFLEQSSSQALRCPTCTLGSLLNF